MNQCMLYLFQRYRLLLIGALFFLCHGCGYQNNPSGTFYFSVGSRDKCLVLDIYDEHDSLVANINTCASVLHSYSVAWFADNAIFVRSADIGDFAFFIDKNRRVSYGFSKIFEPIPRCRFCVIENPSDIVHVSEQNYNPPQTGFWVLPVINDVALQAQWFERKAQGTYDPQYKRRFRSVFDQHFLSVENDIVHFHDVAGGKKSIKVDLNSPAISVVE